MHLYYLSDTAYHGLIGLGISAGILNPDINKPYGLSAFLERLALHKMRDNRSAATKSFHDQVKQGNRWPQWRLLNGEYRIPRCLYLSEPVINEYTAIAIELGMFYKWKRRIIGEPKTTTAATGWVLEAIGCKMIVPESLPLGDGKFDPVSHRRLLDSLHNTLAVDVGA